MELFLAIAGVFGGLVVVFIAVGGVYAFGYLHGYSDGQRDS